MQDKSEADSSLNENHFGIFNKSADSLTPSEIDELINLFWKADTIDEQEVLLKLKSLNLATLRLNLSEDVKSYLNDKFYYDKQMILSNRPDSIPAPVNETIFTTPLFKHLRLNIGFACITLGSALIAIALLVTSSGSIAMIILMIIGIALLLLSINPLRMALSEFYYLHIFTREKEYLPYANEEEFNNALKANKELHPPVIFSKKIVRLIESNCFTHLDLSECNLTSDNLESIALAIENSTSVGITLPEFASFTSKDIVNPIEISRNKIGCQSNINAFYQRAYAFFPSRKKLVIPEINNFILNFLKDLFLIDRESLADKLFRINMIKPILDSADNCNIKIQLSDEDDAWQSESTRLIK